MTWAMHPLKQLPQFTIKKVEVKTLARALENVCCVDGPDAMHWPRIFVEIENIKVKIIFAINICYQKQNLPEGWNRQS